MSDERALEWQGKTYILNALLDFKGLGRPSQEIKLPEDFQKQIGPLWLSGGWDRRSIRRFAMEGEEAYLVLGGKYGASKRRCQWELPAKRAVSEEIG